MRALFHCLLVFVIAIPPLQGGAVAAMPNGSQTVSEHHVHMAAHALSESVDLVMASLADCCHEDGALSKASNAHAKCNASANCCVGAVAPPSTVGDLSSHFSSIHAQTAREPAMTVFVPATLERPPREIC